MNESFLDFLNSIRPNDETIEVASRAFLSELTDDMVPDVMKGKMIESAISREEFDRTLHALEDSPQIRREACLIFLSSAWEDVTQREMIRSAFQGAQAKLPALETGLLALVALYGMYLKTTGGKRKETHIIKHNKDGSFEEKTVTEFEAPAGVMSIVTKLFKWIGK